MSNPLIGLGESNPAGIGNFRASALQITVDARRQQIPSSAVNFARGYTVLSDGTETIHSHSQTRVGPTFLLCSCFVLMLTSPLNIVGPASWESSVPWKERKRMEKRKRPL
jgi:hypothetical protein